MSIPVAVHELGDEVERYGPRAYLLTTSEEGRPHAIHVEVVVSGATARCELGRTSARNGAVRPLVSLLWPPIEEGGYSLIVDGEVVVDEAGAVPRGEISVTRAVLHRPAPAGAASAGANPTASS